MASALLSTQLSLRKPKHGQCQSSVLSDHTRFTKAVPELWTVRTRGANSPVLVSISSSPSHRVSALAVGNISIGDENWS